MNTDRTYEKKHPVLKVVGIVSGIVFLLVLVGLFFTYRAVSAMGLGRGGVADYDTRIVIWENAAGNSSRSKLNDMNINHNGNKALSTMVSWLNGIIAQ